MYEAVTGGNRSIPEDVLCLSEEFCYSSAETGILQHKYAYMRMFYIYPSLYDVNYLLSIEVKLYYVYRKSESSTIKILRNQICTVHMEIKVNDYVSAP